MATSQSKLPNQRKTLFFSGLIFTKIKNLDREKQAEYKIVVETQDALGLRGESGTATVMIRLEDINDNFPVFTQCKPLPHRPLSGQGQRQSRFSDLGVFRGCPKSLYFLLYPRGLLKPE